MNFNDTYFQKPNIYENNSTEIMYPKDAAFVILHIQPAFNGLMQIFIN